MEDRILPGGFGRFFRAGRKENMTGEIIRQTADFIQAMRAGQTRTLQSRLTGDERREVVRELRRRNIFGVLIGLNPTEEGGGMLVTRPEKGRRGR